MKTAEEVLKKTGLMDCSIKWRYNYISGLTRPRKKSESQLLGERLHRLLDIWSQDDTPHSIP